MSQFNKLLLAAILSLSIFFAIRFFAPKTPAPTPTINFSETGHFAKDNPGLKPGVWYLVYEKPGAPALTAELKFDEASICKYGDRAGACPDVLLPSSALTRVRGEMQNGVVRVVDAVSGI